MQSVVTTSKGQGRHAANSDESGESGDDSRHAAGVTWRGAGHSLVSHVYTFHFPEGRKEGHVLFNNALNTFYLWLYGIRHMVRFHSDSERKNNLLLLHGLLFLTSSNGYFTPSHRQEST